MPRNRHDYSVLVKRNEDIFKKIFESDFWRCEYTKRKYILDVQNRSIPDIYSSMKPYNNDLIDNTIRFVMYHADNALGIVNDDSAKRNDLYEDLEQIIVRYHNFINRDNPKYRIGDRSEYGLDLWELVDFLGYGVIDSVRILHADARKYGFFPMDLIAIHPIENAESLIADYKNQFGGFPCFQNSFLMEKEQDPDFNYKDKNGIQYFVDENSTNSIYIYVDCLDEKENVEKICKRIIMLKNMALKQRGNYVAGDRKNADIQICFYDKSIFQDEKKLEDVLKYNLSAYRNWYSPEKFMLTNDTIIMSKNLMVPEYESVSFHRRAAGLWIWDQVHFHKSKVSAAIENARKIKSLKIYDSVEYSSVSRLYNLARMSVEKMEVLKFSDLLK